MQNVINEQTGRITNVSHDIWLRIWSGPVEYHSHRGHTCPRRTRDQQPTGREWSKKSVNSPAHSRGRQDALFHGQGRSHVDARSVLIVREHGNMARTPLADPSTLLRTCFFNIPVQDMPSAVSSDSLNN
ncbi:MAG: hypothetical protein VST68_13905 [Nitrospirota bacterium]|nr:hypothetical protein [Nitrospirota bacterium]